MKIARLAGPLAAALLLFTTVNAAEIPAPADTVVQNLNGVQQCVMTYNVSPDYDPDALDRSPFDLDGFTYTLASMNKVENYHEDKKSHTETVTVKTSRQELSAVLAELPSTKEYNDGNYSGTLTLNTSTIRTEAAGYENSSYPVSATREYGGLDSNDLSYIPGTMNKDGVTLTLQSVDWQVEGSDLVEDMLVPSSYRAVASYSGTGYRKTPTGYVSTASYTGTVSCRVLRDITYTVTYIGEALSELETEPKVEQLGSSDTQGATTLSETAGESALGGQDKLAAPLAEGAGGEIAETLASSDVDGSAELLAEKTDGEDLNQQEQEEPEEKSLSNMLYIILGIITVILIIAFFAWLYTRWQKRRATVMGGDYHDGGTGYPPDSYMGSSDGQYPGEYPEEGTHGCQQDGDDAAGNPYAMTDPYAVEDPYPDGGVSLEGIPYYGSGPYGGQEPFPEEDDAQYADRSEYPEERETAENADWQADESASEQDGESQPPRFLPESGYIQET